MYVSLTIIQSTLHVQSLDCTSIFHVHFTLTCPLSPPYLLSLLAFKCARNLHDLLMVDSFFLLLTLDLTFIHTATPGPSTPLSSLLLLCHKLIYSHFYYLIYCLLCYSSHIRQTGWYIADCFVEHFQDITRQQLTSLTSFLLDWSFPVTSVCLDCLAQRTTRLLPLSGSGIKFFSPYFSSMQPRFSSTYLHTSHTFCLPAALSTSTQNTPNLSHLTYWLTPCIQTAHTPVYMCTHARTFLFHTYFHPTIRNIYHFCQPYPTLHLYPV